jgi:hypothetical protein
MILRTDEVSDRQARNAASSIEGAGNDGGLAGCSQSLDFHRRRIAGCMRHAREGERGVR